MNRPVAILCVVVAIELLGAVATVGWWTWSSAPMPAPPLPDLSPLDRVTAAEIQQRQQRVTSGRAEDWRALAEIYVLYGYFAEADACCHRAAELNPNEFWTWLWWGTALSRLGKTGESSEKFRRAIPLAEGPLGDVCRYCIGLNLLREENPEEAEAVFRSAKGYAPAEYELAKLLARSGRGADAVKLLDGLIAAHPQTEKYLQLRARAARGLGDNVAAGVFQDRADRARQVLSSDELSGFLEEQIGRYGLDGWIQQGQELFAAGAVEQAAERLRNVLDAQWRTEAADLLAHIERTRGHAAEAVSLIQQAIARSGPTPARLVALGDAWQQQGDPAKAVSAWSRAARQRLDAAAHERLSRVAEQAGDGEMARHHRGLSLVAAGIAAARDQRWEAALPLLEQAVTLVPGDAHAWYHLGECRRLLGDVPAAQAAYEQCLTLNPHHGRAHRSLDRLPTQPESAEAVEKTSGD